MSRLIYIHGIGGQDTPSTLRQAWDNALEHTEKGIPSEMAYWADILHPPATPRIGIETAFSDGMADVASNSGNGGFDPGWLLGDPAAMLFAERLSRTLGVADEPIQTEVFPGSEEIRKPVAKIFLKAFIKDTAAYFYKPGTKERMRSRLREKLKPNESHVIVAHSQGTIIAFDVLATLADKSIKVERLVTLGSPLGIQEIQDLVEKPVKAPGNVAHWTNFADLEDPVALEALISKTYSTNTVTVVDTQVNNTHGFPYHAALGYLETVQVRSELAPYVK